MWQQQAATANVYNQLGRCWFFCFHHVLSPETLAGLYEQFFQYKNKTNKTKTHNFTKAHDINQGNVINQVNITCLHVIQYS